MFDVNGRKENKWYGTKYVEGRSSAATYKRVSCAQAVKSSNIHKTVYKRGDRFHYNIESSR